MNILMVVPKYPYPVAGGLERQAHELAKCLIGCGHTVYALSGHFDKRQNNFEIIEGVKVYRSKWIDFKPLRFIFFPLGLIKLMLKLRRQVDLVHIHNISWFGAFVTLLAKICGLPVMTKLPNFGDFGVPGIQKGVFGSLRIAFLKMSDAIVAMTPDSLKELQSIDYPVYQVLKVANGISMLSAALPKQEESIQPQPLQVVFVGRLSPEKGLRDLLHAWRKVQSHHTRPLRLRLIGEGPQSNELKLLVKELGIQDTVEFFGYCNNVPDKLAQADIFVLPSYSEGNSNAILEAMRAGLPIIATRTGGAAIQVGQEGEALLVPPHAPERLAEKLLELIADDLQRFRIGVAMRHRIEEHFSMERITAIYEQAYTLIVSGRKDYLRQINSDLFN